MLLGPPIYDRQNRPLDAPRFTPSARPPAVGQAAPVSGSWPAPDAAPAVQAPEPLTAPVASAGWKPEPESARRPIEPPLLGQQNLPVAGAATPSRATPAVPVGHPSSPQVGQQTTTAPLGRPARPPLEPPQMGQLNRPLQAPAAASAPPAAASAPVAAASAPVAAASAPPAAPERGLSGTAAEMPSGLSAAADAPSGLPGAQPATKPAAGPGEALQPVSAPSGLPIVSGADQTPAPSGLWGVSRNPGTPSGLPGVPSAPAPAPAWTPAPDTEDPVPSGLPLAADTGGDEPAS